VHRLLHDAEQQDDILLKLNEVSVQSGQVKMGTVIMHLKAAPEHSLANRMISFVGHLQDADLAAHVRAIHPEMKTPDPWNEATRNHYRGLLMLSKAKHCPATSFDGTILHNYAALLLYMGATDGTLDLAHRLPKEELERAVAV